MKTILIALPFLISLSAFGAIDTNKCFLQNDVDDYNYCMKKKEKAINATFNSNLNNWKKEKMTANRKQEMINDLKKPLTVKEKQLAELQKEVAVMKANLDKANSIPVNNEPTKKEKTKRKIKKLFKKLF